MLSSATGLGRFFFARAIERAVWEKKHRAVPVAWGWRSADGQIRDCLSSADYASGEGEYTIPLYAAPPQRKPLETKQLEQIMADSFAEKGVPKDWWDWRIKDFARAIERAHGIGGSDE